MLATFTFTTPLGKTLIIEKTGVLLPSIALTNAYLEAAAQEPNIIYPPSTITFDHLTASHLQRVCGGLLTCDPVDECARNFTTLLLADPNSPAQEHVPVFRSLAFLSTSELIYQIEKRLVQFFPTFYKSKQTPNEKPLASSMKQQLIEFYIQWSNGSDDINTFASNHSMTVAMCNEVLTLGRVFHEEQANATLPGNANHPTNSTPAPNTWDLGWAIFYTGEQNATHNLYELQCVGELEIFATDDEAILHVVDKVIESPKDGPYAEALLFLAKHSPNEIDSVIRRAIGPEKFATLKEVMRHTAFDQF